MSFLKELPDYLILELFLVFLEPKETIKFDFAVICDKFQNDLFQQIVHHKGFKFPNKLTMYPKQNSVLNIDHAIWMWILFRKKMFCDVILNGDKYMFCLKPIKTLPEWTHLKSLEIRKCGSDLLSRCDLIKIINQNHKL